MTSSKGGRRLGTALGTLLLALCLAPAAVAAPPWSKPQALSAKGHVWSDPLAVLGEDGYGVVTWTGDLPGRRLAPRPLLAERLPGDARFTRGRPIGPRDWSMAGLGIAEEEALTFHSIWRYNRGIRIRTHSSDGTLGPLQRLGPRRIRGFALDVARDGTAVAAWTGRRGVRASIRSPGGDFGPPIAIVDERRVDFGVAAATGGGAVVVWQRYGRRIGDGRAYASIRPPGGLAFEQPRRLPGTRDLQLWSTAINDVGEVVATFENHTELIAVAASVKAAIGPFDSPAELGVGHFNLSPVVDADSSGRFVAAWDRLTWRFGNLSPQVSTYTDAVGWSGPRPASPRGMSMWSFDLSPAGTVGLGIYDVRRRRQILRASIQPPGAPMSKAERIKLVNGKAKWLITPVVAVDDDAGAVAAWATGLIRPARVFVSSRDPALAAPATPARSARSAGRSPASARAVGEPGRRALSARRRGRPKNVIAPVLPSPSPQHQSSR